MAKIMTAEKLRVGMDVLLDRQVVRIRSVVSGFGETLVNYHDSIYPIVLRSSENITVFNR